MVAVSKAFPGVRALDEVNFAVRTGEIHALVGENGAGKSTIVNMIGGVFVPDTGQMAMDGKPIRFPDPGTSWSHGIAIIHQELALIPEMSVGENILLGHLPSRFGRVDWSELRLKATAVINRIGLKVDADTIVSDLSTGEQQLVEIARAIASEPKLLVMDEPTSALSAIEAARLFAVIRKLRDEGLSTIFISHRLEEVLALADRVTIIRDGKLVFTRYASAVTAAEIAEAMIGRRLGESHGASNKPDRNGPPRLETIALCGPSLLGIDLKIWPGEVVGIAGPLGAGKTELLRTLVGLDLRESGEIQIDGKPAAIDSPSTAISQHIFMVPEDRKLDGLVLEMSVAHNVTLPFLDRFVVNGFFSFHRQAVAANELIENLGVKTADPDQRIAQLSGGNQQKCVLARWLAMEPLVLLLDQPTRGLDVGAKQEVYRLVRDLAKAGIAVLFVATEIPELLEVCHRVLIMRNGRLVGHLEDLRKETERSIFLAAFGAHAQ